MATRFQQLGAFVGSSAKISDDQLAAFSDAGGRWVVVLLAQLGYPDGHDPDCVSNLAGIESFKNRCADHQIACGGWFNGWVGGQLPDLPEGGLGTTALQDAEQVVGIVHTRGLPGPVMLDLESPYKQRPQELPVLVSECRRLMPTRGIAVSTNEPNDSMIWNGGNLGYSKSLRRLGVRFAPQWYNSPNYGGMWMHANETMQWLKDSGNQDNFYDPTSPSNRAVPLSYVHGTLEVTGLEGSDLTPELNELQAAKASGYTTGFSIYMLENAQPNDFSLLKQQRGNLFLV